MFFFAHLTKSHLHIMLCAVLCCRFTRQGCTSRGVETVYRLFLRIPAPTEDLGACAHGHRQEGTVSPISPRGAASDPFTSRPPGLFLWAWPLTQAITEPAGRTRCAVFAYYLSSRPANYAEGQRATTCRFPLGARVALSRAGRCEFGVVLRAHFWI